MSVFIWIKKKLRWCAFILIMRSLETSYVERFWGGSQSPLDPWSITTYMLRVCAFLKFCNITNITYITYILRVLVFKFFVTLPTLPTLPTFWGNWLFKLLQHYLHYLHYLHSQGVCFSKIFNVTYITYIRRVTLPKLLHSWELC